MEIIYIKIIIKEIKKLPDELISRWDITELIKLKTKQ